MGGAGRALQRFVCVALEQLEAVAHLTRRWDARGATRREIAQKQTPAGGANDASSPPHAPHPAAAVSAAPVTCA